MFYFSFLTRFRFYLTILIDKVKLIFSFLMTGEESEREDAVYAFRLETFVHLMWVNSY